MEQHGELFRGVFEALPDAVVIVDDAGVVVRANAQCRTVFGYAAEELVGTPVDALVPVRFRSDHPSRRAGYGARPDPRPRGLLRLAAVRHDGTEFPAEISLAPIEVDGQRFVSATVRDITERIRDEERFRSLLEAAPDPTVIIDTAGMIVLVNDRVQAVFGHTRDELVGRRFDVLAPETLREETLAGFAAYVADPSDVPMGTFQQLVTQHRDGRDIPARAVDVAAAHRRRRGRLGRAA